MTDNRVTTLNTADAIAAAHKRLPLFIFRSGSAAAAYIFGKRVYFKGWML